MDSICLALVCKNEAKFIREALRSAKPYITHWSVLDTGSTDGTQDIVREEMAGIPGSIHQSEWLGWDATRTLSITMAKRSGADWALLLDADETLSGTLPATLSHAIVYDATIRYGAITYDRPNLLSSKQDFEYRGVTHEYLAVKQPRVNSGLTVTTNPERATKTPEKCAEDARLLEDGLRIDPGNLRYQFYLAQSYKDSLQLDKAIVAYALRADGRLGWFEEVYISLLNVARLKMQRGDDSKSIIAAFIEAYEYDPQRAEALRSLGWYLNTNKRFDLGNIFLAKADTLVLPDRKLFVETHCYTAKKIEPLKVLVVIPTQDTRPDMMAEAQYSIMKQTRQPSAVVVARGDGTLASRLNNAIGATDCDAFVILGDDDMLEPTFLEKTAGKMERDGVDIVATNYTHFGAESVTGGNPNHISVTSLFRKSIWKKAGGYADVPYFDWDFVLSCIEANAISTYLPEPLWRYRVHEGQLGYGDKEKNTEAVKARHPKLFRGLHNEA